MLYENVGELAGDFENCKANITRKTSASERTVLVGKPNSTVHVVLSVLGNATSCSRDIFASLYVWIHFLFANKSDIEKTGKIYPMKGGVDYWEESMAEGLLILPNNRKPAKLLPPPPPQQH